MADVIRSTDVVASKGCRIPSVNKQLVNQPTRCEYIERRENVIAMGSSGTGKTHIALGLGLAACQRGLTVGFTTAAALVHELMEARDERRLLNLQKKLSRLKLLIIDELGFVPLSRTGAELLFEVFSQRYERGSILVTANLPFDEWDRGLRVREADRSAAGQADPPRSHPGDERRELQAQTEQAGRRSALFGLTSDLNPQQIGADIFAERLGLGGTLFHRPGGPTCRRP